MEATCLPCQIAVNGSTSLLATLNPCPLPRPMHSVREPRGVLGSHPGVLLLHGECALRGSQRELEAECELSPPPPSKRASQQRWQRQQAVAAKVHPKFSTTLRHCPCCLFSPQFDITSTIYLDRPIASNAEKAGIW